MTIHRIIFCYALVIGAALKAQPANHPRLVVGIVVDQMRMDYIYRYWDKFGDDGFKRLIGNGYLCRNTHFNYVPTFTGPGHASIYTGTTPMHHGIAGNHWYDPSTKKFVYCVTDEQQTPLGTTSEKSRISPKNMLAPSLGDAIRTASLFKGKSIGISLKDRSAVLPAGHSANAAYWMDNGSGNMVSSSYYMEKLPKWVDKFNAAKHADKLSKEGWTPLLDLSRYTESTTDNTPYEKPVGKGGKPVFPYDLTKGIRDNGYSVFAMSPFSNTLLRLFAEQCIIHDELGMDEHCDLLAISFSQPDLIGHTHGPQSIEVEDSYLRLDLEIAELLSMLDMRVGAGSYVLFLTADHAAAHVAQYLADNKIPAGYIDNKKISEDLKSAIDKEYGAEKTILCYMNQQVYYNDSLIGAKSIDRNKLDRSVRDFMEAQPGVMRVYPVKELVHLSATDEVAAKLLRGIHPQRSGQLVVQYLPGWMEYDKHGTTHGTSFSYDTHVPLIFYGAGVRQGETYERTDITQVAPTIALLCRIAFPDASDHRPVDVFIGK